MLWLLIIFLNGTQVIKLGRLWLGLRLLLFLYSWLFLYLLYLRCLLFLLRSSGSFVARENLGGDIRLHGHRSLIHHHHLHEHFIHLLSLSRIVALVLRHHLLELHHHCHHHLIILLVILSITLRILCLICKWLHFGPFFVLVPFDFGANPSIDISPSVGCACLILIFFLLFFLLIIVNIDYLCLSDLLSTSRLYSVATFLLLLPNFLGSHLGRSGCSIIFGVHIYYHV